MSERPRFEIRRGYDHELLGPFAEFLAGNGMKIAAIELIEDRDGNAYAYDVNVNTNYNADAERRAGLSGMGAVASYLGAELLRRNQNVLKAVCASP